MPTASTGAAIEPVLRALGSPEDTPIALLASDGGAPFGSTSLLALASSIDHLSAAPLFDALHAPARSGATGGAIACVAYEVGAAIEPTATTDRSKPRRGFPLGTLMRTALPHRFSHLTESWDTVPAHAAATRLPTQRAGSLSPVEDDATFMRAVERAREYVRAGDIFQANVARQWAGSVPMPMREFAMSTLARVGARFGAYLELGNGRGVLSLSPELFLSVEPRSRLVRTRPIKGTRAAGGPTDELERCEKERAELHMIVDLMRNDLGRVCEIGSVRVSAPRSIEHHPTVQHAVAEVSGTLRAGTTHASLLRATFPPGSVTGAPKVRAMQVIDELEPFERGPYCGAIGWLGDDGAATLSVAIRTFELRDAGDGTTDLRYRAGCGIVADSCPTRECAESHEKAAVALLAVLAR